MSMENADGSVGPSLTGWTFSISDTLSSPNCLNKPY